MAARSLAVLRFRYHAAMTYSKSLFIFRRDLRLDDNTGLLEAHKGSKTVMPCFVFDPNQVEKHDYLSLNALQFMLESLEDLANQIKARSGELYFFYDHPHKALTEIIHQEKIEAVYINRDYTPYSQKRDDELAAVCSELGVALHSFGDVLLHEPEEISNDNAEPYTVFTSFWKKASNLSVRKPRKHTYKNFMRSPPALRLDEMIERILPYSNPNLFARGGRASALKVLRALGEYSKYENERDYPSREATTGLSAHNKFGTCSIRELFYALQRALGPKHPLLRQLFWRDFFTHIAFHFPHVFGNPFRTRYNDFPWENDQAKFELWCRGETGFPVVDAGMRQLNATGCMHNRVRMLTASFLVKDLHIDWRWGEKYFASKLVDYDPAVNNGNWQWCASTGCDAQPYFRIFNPWLQQKKFDPDCEYIKRWVPELQAFEAKEIHALQEKRPSRALNYPPPMVQHLEEKRRAERFFHRASGTS